jgi:hypothetical protein
MTSLLVTRIARTRASLAPLRLLRHLAPARAFASFSDTVPYAPSGHLFDPPFLVNTPSRRLSSAVKPPPRHATVADPPSSPMVNQVVRWKRRSGADSGVRGVCRVLRVPFEAGDCSRGSLPPAAPM